MQVKKYEKIRPGAFTTIPRRFSEKRFRGFWCPRAIRIKKKKRHTPLKTRGDTKKQEKNPTPLTRTEQQQGSSSRC